MSHPTRPTPLATSDPTNQAASLTHAMSSSQPHPLSMPHSADHAAAVTRIGAWEWRLHTQHVEWSPEANALFGLPTGSFDDTAGGFLSRVPPIDRPALQAAIQAAMADRQPYVMEHRVVLPDGTTRWISCRGQAIAEENGDLLGMAGTIEDITSRKEAESAFRDLQQTLERRVRDRTAELEQTVRDLEQEIARRQQTDAALKASEQRYLALYEHNPSMYFTLAPEGTILSVNGFGAEELGYRQTELIGRSVLCVFQPHDHQTVLGQLIACSERPGKTFDWEIQKVRKDGRLLWVRERARAITDPEGQRIILVVCEDITDRRRTEEAMRESDARLRATTQFLHTLVRESPLPIVSLDARAKVTSWNHAATTLFGWTEEEVLGRELPYIPSEQEAEAEAEALWNQGTQNMIRGPLALRRQRKNGSMVDLLFWPMSVYDENAALSTAIGLYVDQSDLQRAEAARLHGEERLRSFLNALDDLAFELDDQGTYLNVWTRNEATLLLPKPEIIGKSLVEVHGQEAGTYYLAILRRVLASGTSESIEYTLSPKGQPRYFSAILSRIPAGAEIPATVACIVRETTAQKETELALRESEARLQEAQAMAHLGNWELDLVKNRLIWSDEIFRIFEIDKTQFSASYEAFLNAVHPDDRTLVNDAYTRSVQNRAPYEIVHRLQMPDGRIKYVQERGETYYDGEGHPHRSVGTIQDITERRTEQLQLQHSQALLNSIFEHLPNMLFVKDARTLRFVEFNKAGEHLTGFSREELLGKSDYDLFPRKEADFFTGKDRAVLASGSMLEIPEEEIQTKHRGVRILQTKKVPLCDAHGIPQYLLGISEDITDRKQAEEALRVSEERFAKAFRSSPHPIIVTERDTGRCLEVNEAALALFGYRRDEVIGQTTIALGLWPTPEDRANFFSQLTAEGTLRNIELPFYAKGGAPRQCLISCEPIDLNGTPCLVTVGTDITEQKRALEALHLSEQHLKSIIETSPECVKLVAADGTLLQINSAGLAMIEADDVQDVLGQCVYPLVAASHRDAFRAMNERVCLGQKESLEFEVVGLRGTPRWMETHAVPLRNPADGSVAQLAITRDVTDRKQAELALRLSEERFEIAFRSSPHPVVITELATGRCIEVNDTALQLFGFQRHEAVGHTTIAIELWPKPEDRTRFVTQLLANGSLRGVEFTFQTKDHRLRHCLVSSELIELNGTRCILTVGTDVTEKKEAEAALRESEERWQRFVADAPVGLVIADADKRILSANKAFCTLTGYSEQEVINNTYALYTHPDDLPKNLQLTEEFFSGQRDEYTYEKRYVRKDGEIIWVSIRASRLTVHGYDTPLLLAVVEDITDRKQALAERERISQDLHDNILQSLYAVGMQLEAGKLLAGKAPRKSKQHVTQAIRQLNHLVLGVRQFITGLTRRTAPALDFSVALKQLVASFLSDEHGTPALEIDREAIASVTPAVGEQLLNITREALSNSLRHAGAAHRSVSLNRTDARLRLRIADNGIGFDAARKRRRGQGLANMAARAKTIHAQFTLDSTPGRGTCITIDVPTGGPHVR
jgi:PAS domain S-box-containing protein